MKTSSPNHKSNARRATGAWYVIAALVVFVASLIFLATQPVWLAPPAHAGTPAIYAILTLTWIPILDCGLRRLFTSRILFAILAVLMAPMQCGACLLFSRDLPLKMTALLWPDIIVNIIFIAALLTRGRINLAAGVAAAARRWCCQRSLMARGLVLLHLGAGILCHWLCWVTRLKAQATYLFGTMTTVDTFGPAGARVITPPEANEPFVVRELWIRLLLPPPLRPPCSTRKAWVCTEVDSVVSATPAQWRWSAYWVDVGLGSISVAANSILVWLYTRRKG